MNLVRSAISALLSIIIDGLRLNHDCAMGGIRPVPEPWMRRDNKEGDRSCANRLHGQVCMA